ncbi:MAG: acyl-ACP--UDP-N-acetylglucosamine O-acyltransferase [Candidatus Omnitrophica bacterium]|nr:acyl-ACP--UDP-N-acetylglucosamine O-acyltransferase [Candidatus Omnitrophota bacterium]
MSGKIDKKAIVSEKARLDSSVIVGPYAVIGPDVEIGQGTIIDAFAQIVGNTKVGKNCHIFSHAVLGNPPQDLKYKGEKTFLVVGDNNIIREFVTMNLGTEKDSKTLIGSNNLIMAYSHVAHDCIIGNNNVLANCATLAGHVTIEDRVTVGGLVAIHQFCRLGMLSIVGGCSKVVQDVAPFSMSDGHPSVTCGLNLIGLKRANFSLEAVRTLKKAFKIIFFEGHTFDKAEEMVKKELPLTKELNYLLSFISSSKRGLGRQ